MNDFDEIDYWLESLQSDLKLYDTPEKMENVRKLFYSIAHNKMLFYYILDGRKGIVAYSIYPDYRGELSLLELFIYIKSEYRGSFKLFKELINHIEQVAKDNNCKSVKIGANLKYKDHKILRTLKSLGYSTDTVVKYL